jgi:hypothetical protein
MDTWLWVALLTLYGELPYTPKKYLVDAGGGRKAPVGESLTWKHVCQRMLSSEPEVGRSKETLWFSRKLLCPFALDVPKVEVALRI